MRNRLVDTAYLVRDFIQLLRGKDYFRQRLGLGNYFKDSRSYYVDFSKKAYWKGPTSEDGIPLLLVPRLERHIQFPGMVIQYGLGSLEAFIQTGDQKYLDRADGVAVWLEKNVNPEFYYRNYFLELEPQDSYYSDNSAMTQGLAMSFLLRVLQCRNEGDPSGKITALVQGLYRNMCKSITDGGTAVYGEDGTVYFCETCSHHKTQILNGWIFAIFALFDYQRHFKDADSAALLEKTMQTLEARIGFFIRDNGWSYYDDMSRLCSPIYQNLHIDLLEALCRLRPSAALEQAKARLKAGNTALNITRYTLQKIVQKLTDSNLYTSA